MLEDTVQEENDQEKAGVCWMAVFKTTSNTTA